MTNAEYAVGARSRPIRWRKTVRTCEFYLLLLVVMVPFVLPFVWMVLNSLKNQRDLLAIPPTFIFIPTLESFRVVLGIDRLPTYFMNSTIIAVASAGLALVLGSPAAFAIARYRQSRLANSILLARILPHVSVLLPWYVAFALLGLNDTYPALILTHMVIALPLTIWILVPFYEGLSSELLDAALIDGCSLRQSFLRVALPLSLPGIAVAAILSFTTSWNNFMLSFVVSGPRTMTMPVVAYNQIAFDRINFGAMAASAMVVTAPVLLVTLFVQRYLVTGLTLGATAGQ